MLKIYGNDMQFLNGQEKLITEAIIKIDQLLENRHGFKLSLGERQYFDYGLLYLLQRKLGGPGKKELKSKAEALTKIKIDDSKNPWCLQKNGEIKLKDSCEYSKVISTKDIITIVDEVASAEIAKIQLAQYEQIKDLRQFSKYNRNDAFLY